MTPGPTGVPPQVLAALAEPVTHHRTPEFRAILEQVQRDLRYVLQTEQPVSVITGSGTAALEAGLATVLAPGSRVLSIESGRFARRWAEMARVYGMQVTSVAFEAGTHVTPEAMSEHLRRGGFDAVFITHSETSTATACDLAAIAKEIRERAPEALIFVDGITSIGAMPFRMDAWGIDLAVTGSQKALMIPPGLAYVALSDRAWSAADGNARAATYYLDLKRYREAAKKSDTPFTPTIPLVKAQAVALAMLREEGLEHVWRRTRAHADIIRRGMAATGLELLSRMPADSVTAVRYPQGVDDGFRTLLAREHNIHVAGGQDELTGRIFRVNHMGYTDLHDALACVAATEHVLRELGQPVEPGRGLAAAQEVIAAYAEAARTIGR